MSLLAPLAEGDLGLALQGFCRAVGNEGALRDLRYYGRFGRVFAPPTPLDGLPREAKAKVDAALERTPPRPGDGYGNCLRAVLAAPGARYCEGVYADLAFRFPRQHAWLEVDGHTFDPTYQVALPLASGPGAAYFGVSVPTHVAASIMLGEGCLRPVALGPARSPRQRRIEDGVAG